MELAELPAVHFADPEGFTFMPLLLDVSGVDQRQLGSVDISLLRVIPGK